LLTLHFHSPGVTTLMTRKFSVAARSPSHTHGVGCTVAQ